MAHYLDGMSSIIQRFEQRMLETVHLLGKGINGSNQEFSIVKRATLGEKSMLNAHRNIQLELKELDDLIERAKWLDPRSIHVVESDDVVIDDWQMFSRLPHKAIMNILSMYQLDYFMWYPYIFVNDDERFNSRNELVSFGYFKDDQRRTIRKVFPHVIYETPVLSRESPNDGNRNGQKTNEVEIPDEKSASPSYDGYHSASIDDQQFCSIISLTSSCYMDFSYNLIQSPQLLGINNNIEKLILQYNDITDQGVESICSNLPQISHLDLSSTAITDESAKYFTILKRLNSLILNKNVSLTDQTLRSICTGSSFSNIHHLSMKGCSVGDEGIKFLTYSLLTGENLIRTIDLSENMIGDAGMERFLLFMLNGKHSHSPDFQWLDLHDNSKLTNNGRNNLALYYHTGQTRIYLRDLLRVERALHLIKQILNTWKYKRSKKNLCDTHKILE